jgi:hypothetical protein
MRKNHQIKDEADDENRDAISGWEDEGGRCHLRQLVGLTTRARLATGVGRHKNAWMRATNPISVGSIGMTIRPKRSKKPGRSGMT